MHPAAALILLGLAPWASADPLDGTERPTPPAPDGPEAPVEPTGIVNGELESGWDSVVSIGAGPFSLCSGNLITPKIVLTAGHCGADLPAELVVGFADAVFGPSVAEEEHRIGFVDFAVHPDYSALSTTGLSQTLPAFDLALLELEEEAPVEPVWVRTDKLKKGEAVGAEVVSVGFGITSAAGAGSGVKRSARLVVDELDEMFLLSNVSTNENGANICSGDSGGPQFHQDPETGRWEQWGVHSWGDANCLFESGSTRTDVGADFLLDFVEKVHGTTDPCAFLGRYGDGPCDLGCARLDPDCAVQTDEEALAALAGGCDSAGGPAGGPGGLLVALLGLLGARRRSRIG